MKFTAAGDAIIGRRIQQNFSGYEELTSFIEQGDARFFNLETTLNYEGECFASQFSGGTYLRTNPEVLEDLKRFGFNMTSYNNNHAFDYSFEGFFKTMEYVKASGLVQAGVGMNLAEASAPKYLDTDSGRVALIAVNTSFNPAMMAGIQSQRIKGRPGINGLRSSKVSVVKKEDIDALREIASRTGINAYNEILIKEGYEKPGPADRFSYGGETFVVGEQEGIRMALNEADMTRIEKSIHEAKLQADYIMISVHSHQITGDKKEIPADFLIDFAHRCVDAGADAIVGHGPHLLRPIEVYKDRPIFYSLGDFILQLYNVEFAPPEMYEKNGVSLDKTTHDLLAARSHNFTIGLMEQKVMFETVIPYWETDETGKLQKLTLMPVLANMKGNKSEIGLPRRDYEVAFFDRLAEMCKPYGVTVTMTEDKMLECSW